MLAPFNDIYIFEVEVTSQNLFAAKNFLNILSSFELSQLNKFKTYDDYAVYLVSHVILRMLISKYTSIKADKIIYGYNKNGKPFLFSKIKNFKFNLSHSTERILIGFYNKEIGVDIEYKKELENYNDLAHYVFSEEEKSCKRLAKPV
jgi:4'-phosphopantetheinyl transferase